MSHPSCRDHLTAMAALAKKLHMSYGNLRAAVDRGEIPDPAPELRRSWDPVPVLPSATEEPKPRAHRFRTVPDDNFEPGSLRPCIVCGQAFRPRDRRNSCCSNPACRRKRNSVYQSIYQRNLRASDKKKEGEPNGL